MSRRVVPPLTRRVAIGLTLCIALLPTHHIWLLATEAAQGRPEESEQKAKPKPGKPEGMFPNLEDVRKEKQFERQAPPPIPSTIRSKRNTGKPWDGRRVGDPWPEGTSVRWAWPLVIATSPGAGQWHEYSLYV